MTGMVFRSQKRLVRTSPSQTIPDHPNTLPGMVLGITIPSHPIPLGWDGDGSGMVIPFPGLSRGCSPSHHPNPTGMVVGGAP